MMSELTVHTQWQGALFCAHIQITIEVTATNPPPLPTELRVRLEQPLGGGWAQAPSGPGAGEEEARLGQARGLACRRPLAPGLCSPVRCPQDSADSPLRGGSWLAFPPEPLGLLLAREPAC